MRDLKYRKVYIVILNYNNLPDTIECLESVLRNSYLNYQVIVIDNNSPDKSMDRIIEWAKGNLDLKIKANRYLKRLSHPPLKKPIPLVFYKREDAEKGGNPELEKNAAIADRLPLIFIQTGDNLGFGAGNNVGLKYLSAKNDFDYVWILNNDTVIEKDTLINLANKAEIYRAEHKKVGIVGSKLLYYNNPKIIQGIGGKFNKWLGAASHIGIFEEDKGQYDNEEIVKRIDYIIGSSMFVSKEFIKEVGLMCEDYFLYFEEIDWALRGKKEKWQIGYCWNSMVYHKTGATIGSNFKIKERSEIADYYGLKNKILIAKKFYPKYLWSVYLIFFIMLFNRIIKKQFSKAKLVLKILKNELIKY